MNHSEECVIGSILSKNSCMADVLKTGIKADYFSSGGDDVFRVILAIYERGQPIDAVTLAHELIKAGVCEDENHVDFVLIPCMDRVPNAAHADVYTKQTIEAWQDRQLRNVDRELSTSSRTVDERIAKLRKQIDMIESAGPKQHSEIIRATELIKQYPDLKPILIDGLVRLGETANIIASTKIGKSWLCYDLALSVATGNQWCGRFETKKGRVLLVDNELDRETLSYRIRKVAKAMGLAPIDYANAFDVWPMRGKLQDIFSIRQSVNAIPHGYYSLIIVDSWYRMLPVGVSENANAEMTQLANCVDEYALTTGAAWAPVHHSTKGDQGDKRVTDVGAGAGSMARAADSHIILREHAEPNHFVMDAAVRSFPPLEPVTLRWEFPTWHFADDVDAKLATRKNSKQSAQDAEGIAVIRKVLSTDDQGDDSWLTETAIRGVTGMGAPRNKKLLGLMKKSGEVISRPGTYQTKDTTEYQLTKQS
jgi:hypothetical protein